MKNITTVILLATLIVSCSKNKATETTEVVQDVRSIVTRDRIESCQFKTVSGTFIYDYGYPYYTTRCALLKIGDEVLIRRENNSLYWVI